MFNFAVTVKDDEETHDFMYRLLGGMIFAIANSPALALNFYPMLGELGTVSERLAKTCHWSTTLFGIIQKSAHGFLQNLSNPEQTTAWLRTVTDKEMGARLRLFVHQFVTVPHTLYDMEANKEMRLVMVEKFSKIITRSFWGVSFKFTCHILGNFVMNWSDQKIQKFLPM